MRQVWRWLLSAGTVTAVGVTMLAQGGVAAAGTAAAGRTAAVARGAATGPMRPLTRSACEAGA